MRYTLILGKEDGVSLKVFGASLICAIMKTGKAIDDITFEVLLTGKELLNLLSENGISESKIISEIIKENHYKVIAYDW